MTPLLVDVRQAAALLGVGVRTVHKLRHDATFPQPIALGARATRWKTSELAAWTDSRPRVAERPEPAELTAARAKRGSNGGAGGGTEAAPSAKPRPEPVSVDRLSVELPATPAEAAA